MRSIFTFHIKNRFQALAYMENINEPNIEPSPRSTVYKKNSEACLRIKERKRKEWIRPATWQVTEVRKHLKKKLTNTKPERLQKRYKQHHGEMD